MCQQITLFGLQGSLTLARALLGALTQTNQEDFKCNHVTTKSSESVFLVVCVENCPVAAAAASLCSSTQRLRSSGSAGASSRPGQRPQSTVKTLPSTRSSCSSKSRLCFSCAFGTSNCVLSLDSMEINLMCDKDSRFQSGGSGSAVTRRGQHVTRRRNVVLPKQRCLIVHRRTLLWVFHVKRTSSGPCGFSISKHKLRAL